VTILTATDLGEAYDRLRRPCPCEPREWLAASEVDIRDIVPVRGLELGVGPRRNLNTPTFCRLKLPRDTLVWRAPGRSFGEKPSRWDLHDAGSSIDRLHVWAYVWQERELVFFDAPDFDSACSRALSREAEWGFEPTVDRRAVSADVEPVDRLELRLRPRSLESAPRYYRAWIDGVEVGWPERDPDNANASVLVPPATPGTPPATHATPPPEP
jgi:hypothetical protein